MNKLLDSREPTDELLLRVLLWERSKYARSLAGYLASAERPYRLPPEVDLPASVLDPLRGRKGTFFELFTVPVRAGQVSDLLRESQAGDGVEVTLELSNLPVLVCLRKTEPGDPTAPYQSFLPVLKLLPRGGARARSPRAGARALARTRRLPGPGSGR